MDHLQCTECNPVSAKFRRDITKTMLTYLESRQCSHYFITLFLQALDCWLFADHPVTLVTSEAYPRQADIGWRLFISGFLTRQWRTTLERTHKKKPGTLSITLAESILIIAGAIKLLWQATGQLWLSHLETIHQHKEHSLSPVTTADLQSNIRWMHTMKSQVLATLHQYFHDNVDTYLQHATPEDMTNYITQYLTAKQWYNHTMSPVSDSQHSNTPSDESSISSDTSSTPSRHTDDNTPRPHQDLGEPSHCKRNRRRFGTGLVQTLLNWLQQRQP